MKKLLIALFITISFLPAMSQAYYTSQNLPFQAGERIDYTVFYNVIGLYVNAGSASFTTSRTMYDDQDVFHVVGEGKIYPERT